MTELQTPTDVSSDSRTVIRKALPEDLESIAEIYNEAVAEDRARFDAVPVGVGPFLVKLEDEEHSRLAVAQLHSGEIVGWASVSRSWVSGNTGRVSFYVARDHRNQGVGRQLKEWQIRAGGELGLHSLIAEVHATNGPSRHLNHAVGFSEVGRVREAGRESGAWTDLILFQYNL